MESAEMNEKEPTEVNPLQEGTSPENEHAKEKEPIPIETFPEIKDAETQTEERELASKKKPAFPKIAADEDEKSNPLKEKEIPEMINEPSVEIKNQDQPEASEKPVDSTKEEKIKTTRKKILKLKEDQVIPGEMIGKQEEGGAHAEAGSERNEVTVIYLNDQMERIKKLAAENQFRDFWFYVKEISNFLFTTLRLRKEQRTDFKKQIGELCEEVKERQDRIKEETRKTSAEKKEGIKKLLEEAFGFEPTIEGIELSFNKINEAQKLFHQKKADAAESVASFDDDGLTRNDRERLRDDIKKAKDEIFSRKRKIRQNNFEQVAARLKQISDKVFYENPRDAFNQIKKLRVEMRNIALDRDHVKEIDGVIKQLWDKASEKINVRRNEDLQHRTLHLESLINKNHQFIKRLQKEIEDINIKWADVQNDMFRNRMNEWIEEKTQKIAQVEADNKSIADKISFLKEQEGRV